MIEGNPRIVALQKKLAQVRGELNEALAETAHGEVKDYVFGTAKGAMKLSDLFGRRRDLFVMHNMGIDCPNCTMFADGFNGLYPHISNRAAFAVATPDPAEAQAVFAAQRGWRFPVLSCSDNTFPADMGFMNAKGMARPGLSVFRKGEGGAITRISATNFLRQDDFCAAWMMFDLLPEGADGWYPKFAYE